MSTTTPDEPPSTLTPPSSTLGAGLAVIVARALRLTTMLGVISLVIASATLMVYGAVNTIMQIVELVSPREYRVANRDIFLSSIKLIDLVLLGTIMQVVGIGLFSLLVGKKLPVPQWLMTADIDDLKNKLAGIVAIMLGVSFLEQLFYWGTDRDLMRLGIGIAAVMAALSYFIRSSPDKPDK
jgi:uncharacterized membrane protein YqhA